MKVVLSIAGSDSSGGAGIQADLKTFEAFGVFGTTAVTVVTAQNTKGVTGIQSIDAQLIKKQVQAVLEDFDVAAIKIGMLLNKEIIITIREIIKDLDIPIVLDPVFISKAGSKLLEDDAVQEMKTLFEYVSLITPNMHEAYNLFGYKFGDSNSLETVQNVPSPVLIKNQILELPDGSKSLDMLIYGHQKRVFESPELDSINLHGTGCSYSSAIAANLALDKSLLEAIEISKEFIYQAILHAPNIGHGAGPINHQMGVKNART
jgi:hydroxymethylpyrimidine/phosphomethylpyrimidine kinase